MKTLKLTSKDFKKKEGNYWSDYIGKEKVDGEADISIEIEANLGWVRFDRLWVKGSIIALAGSGIEAGSGIKAGWGIEAGEGITCKLSLNVAYRIFAGLAIWLSKSEITEARKTITCGKLEHGDVEYGILKETGLPDEKKSETLRGKKVKVELDGQTYTATID